MGKKFKREWNGRGFKFAVITSMFEEEITQRLSQATIECLIKYKVNFDDIEEFFVPGAFEISLIAKKIAETKKYDAIICNGAVIRGETPHFDQVVNAVTTGVNQVGLNYGLPVIFGVLTTDTVEQALDRSGLNDRNKGRYCALAALEMVNLLKKIS